MSVSVDYSLQWDAAQPAKHDIFASGENVPLIHLNAALKAVFDWENVSLHRMNIFFWPNWFENYPNLLRMSGPNVPVDFDNKQQKIYAS